MMGIFPMNYEPKNMIRVNWGDADYLDEHPERIIVMKLYNQFDVLEEIDNWVGENMKFRIHFYQDFRKTEAWVQCFHFMTDEDLMAFKLAWS